MSTNITINSRYLKLIRVGELQAKYNVDGTRILRYYIDFWHDGLRLHKDLSAPEIYMLQGKVNQLVSSWDDKYDIMLNKQQLNKGKEAADDATIDAQNRLDQLKRILAHTLTVDDRINWDTLKNTDTFRKKPFPDPKPKLIKSKRPIEVQPQITIWNRLFGQAKKKRAASLEVYRKEVQIWEEKEAKAENTFLAKLSAWETARDSFEADQDKQEAEFKAAQFEHNSRVEDLAAGISVGDINSVVEHATLVLENSDYGDLFEKSFQLEYRSEEKALLLEYTLPSPDDMPTLKQVRFIKNTGEMKEAHISVREKKENFDLVCYQICLRTIHELFEADEYKNIDKILFNGTACYIDRTTGQDVTSCIMSVLVDRNTFLSIDLRRVDPKACFKSLKGVSASSLSSLAAIPPVIELNKNDRRFIDGRATLVGIDNATNLAAMDWNDFEHLVRELFEKEFATRGGDVKVTQSSSDGGVDAVAFDPDPITGGKIVIQAKRYTRTVGVSAVRDLFGTMQHEGASRGVLITTADYGPDAYKFASGKPITLFTGSNLLHLLEKHGYNAKIDLKEAREASRVL